MNAPLIIGTNGYVLAIDTETGNELWRTKLRDGILGGSRGSDVSVMLDDKTIYAGCAGRIYAIDLNGSILWSNELPGLGHSIVSLSKNGTSVQFITRVAESSSSSDSH